MKLLEDRILSEGKVLAGDVLKVDGFLNHRMDVALLAELGKDVYNHFKNTNFNLVLTVEASGIGLASMCALAAGCKLLVAKKHKSSNISDGVYSAEVFSYTHGVMNNVIVSKEYLSASDNVLIVDDFLASGNAGLGLISLVRQAGGTVAGFSAAIEKTYQGGRKAIEDAGVEVYSLACISAMSEKGVTFSDN